MNGWNLYLILSVLLGLAAAVAYLRDPDGIRDRTKTNLVLGFFIAFVFIFLLWPALGAWALISSLFDWAKKS